MRFSNAGLTDMHASSHIPLSLPPAANLSCALDACGSTVCFLELCALNAGLTAQ